MRQVKVLGVGLHKFGRFPEKSVEMLCHDAISAALQDAGVSFKQVQASYVGVQQTNPVLSRRLIQHFGWTGIPITTVSQACASSSAAFREAYIAVAAGIYDLVLVVGYEKMGKGLLTAGNADEARKRVLYAMGLDAIPARVAIEMQERMEKYQEPIDAIAQVAVQASETAALNPFAQYQERHSLQDVLNSAVVSSPLTLYMCCPTTDGASAAVIASADVARRIGNTRTVTVAGWAAGSPPWQDLTSGPGEEIGGDVRGGLLTKRLAKAAYEMSGFGAKDIGVAQVHDPYAVAALVDIEALGFAPEGLGGRWFMEGKTRINGKIPINTDGGLLCRGHPLGATGIAQITEIVRQIRGEAGARQVPKKPKTGLTHNSGAGLINIFTFKA